MEYTHCRRPPKCDVQYCWVGQTDRPRTLTQINYGRRDMDRLTAINIHSMAVTRTVQIWQRGETWGNTAV
jgi:hypothetical protein